MTPPAGSVERPGGLLNASVVTLSWRSYETTHRDACFFAGLSPRDAMSRLVGAETPVVHLEPGDVVPDWDPGRVIEIDHTQFNRAPSSFARIAPRVGQHYATRLLADMKPEVVGDAQVFRCLSQTPSGLRIDLNPPLSGVAARLEAVDAIPDRSAAPDWDQKRLRWRLLQSGPGLQARRRDVSPDWPSDEDLQREDENDDTLFYTEPRFVTHIDDTTIQQVSRLYARLIEPGARVLDLMSSWISHLPEDVSFGQVVGLGMNRRELAANPVLDEHRVHNLNQEPRLPFPDGSFDAVVCAVSVEYLCQPLAVFEDVRRVLAPGGVFVNVFSNRCFPTKAIALWARLHEFERMGLIAHFYRRAEFSNVNTWSLRGLPKPVNDPYVSQSNESDPVYAVWASK